MALRPIIRWGDPVLHAPSAPVKEFDGALATLVKDMVETMYAAPGIGLAAPQIGVPLRVIVIDLSVGEEKGALITVVNPEFVEREGEQRHEEGRGRERSPPPLKPVAAARGLKVLQPRRVREPESVAALEALVPEVQVVVAYGQILPRRVIDIAPRGTVNVHASLLPRYRGAAPVQWAIVHGEAETGVTTMLIDEGLDTGPLLLAEATPIGAEETADALESRLPAS